MSIIMRSQVRHNPASWQAKSGKGVVLFYANKAALVIRRGWFFAAVPDYGHIIARVLVALWRGLVLAERIEHDCDGTSRHYTDRLTGGHIYRRDVGYGECTTRFLCWYNCVSRWEREGEGKWHMSRWWWRIARWWAGR